VPEREFHNKYTRLRSLGLIDEKTADLINSVVDHPSLSKRGVPLTEMCGVTLKETLS